MANEDLNVKLVLDAVNNMSGKLDQAGRDLNRVTQAMDLAQKKAQQAQIGMKGSLFSPETWSVLAKDAEMVERRMNALRSSGMEKMATGAVLLAPVMATVKAAGDLEEVMNQIKIDIYDSGESTDEWNRKAELLRQTTLSLSRDVRYGAAEIGLAVDELARGNVEVQDIADGAAKAAVYLAQASKGDVSTAGAAESVAKIGNAWQLTGKELEQVADTLARVDAASTASIPSLIDGFRYVSSTASNLNLDVREVAVALGILNNAGLDGSTAGVTLNQMLQHLQPTTKAAQEMFESLGLSVEQNPFFDADGKMKPLVEIIRILRNATADLTDQQKQLAFKSVFDERGSRAVINLLKEGKNSYEDIEGSLDRQMSLWDRIKTQNQGLNMQIEILKGNVTTLLSESGSPLGQELTGMVQSANDIVVKFTEWSKENPEVLDGLLRMLGTMGGILAAAGAAQVAVAGIVKTLGPILTNPVGAWLAGVGLAAHGANQAAPYIPGTGLYTDRMIDEELAKYDNRGALADRPAMLAPAPPGTFDPWYVKAWNSVQPYIGPSPTSGPMGAAGRFIQESAAAAAGPVNITIYPRDAQETAQEIRRILDRPVDVKYQRSRMPVED